MKLTNRFYNEDLFRQKAEECLDNVAKQEATQWLQHPCTKCLVNMLQADMCGILNIWLGGGYTDEKSSDSTAQKEAKARGMAQAMDDVIETIESIGSKNIEGDFNND